MGRTFILLYLHKSLPAQLSNTEMFVPTLLNLDDVNYMSNSIVGDLYMVLARRWLEMGVIEQAKVIAIRYPPDHPRYSPQGIYDLGNGLKVYVLPNIEQYTAIHKPGIEDVLFIRGQSSWEPILAHHSDNFKVFYNGSSKEQWRPRWPVDMILTDDPSHKLPGVRCVEFVKCTDEAIFRPLGLTKCYDLCFIGTFAREDKKGQLEFARLADRGWKAIFVGEFADMSAVDKLKQLWPSCEVVEELPKDQVNEVLNRSKVSVVFSQSQDAAPRIVVESMASGAPVMIHKRNIGRKYITAQAGEVAGSRLFRWKVGRVIRNFDRYQPRAEYEKHFHSRKVARELWEKLGIR